MISSRFLTKFYFLKITYLSSVGCLSPLLSLRSIKNANSCSILAKAMRFSVPGVSSEARQSEAPGSSVRHRRNRKERRCIFFIFFLWWFRFIIHLLKYRHLLSGVCQRIVREIDHFSCRSPTRSLPAKDNFSRLLRAEYCGIMEFSAVHSKDYSDIVRIGIRTYKAQIDRFGIRLVEYHCARHEWR